MDSFSKYELIPDVIDQTPLSLLEIKWSDSNVSANLGNIVTPTQIKKQPAITWNANENDYFTLIMTDPDVPTRKDPISGEFQHWLVVNIPGNKISEGQIKSNYLGSGAPKDTGLHRYLFLVFKQQSKQNFDNVEELIDRAWLKRKGFKTREFIKKNNLGELVAANFVQAEYDDYSDELRNYLLSLPE